MNKKAEKIMGTAFFGPALVLLTLFLFIPMILTLVFSFTDFFTLDPQATKFVGLENYTRLFKDELFGKAFLNTIKFAIIVVPLQMGGALLLAMGINKVTHCKKYFKVAFFIPVVMSLAVVSTLWMQLYNPDGLINTILNNLGIASQPFIHSKEQALQSISIMSIWQGMGYQMIIFLGALQAISPSLYEAAEIDSASSWKTFVNVTLPELKPITVYVLLTITIGAFKLVVQPMVMTGGGPAFSTYSMVYYIYETGTVNWDMGYASAMSIIFAILVIALAGIQNWLTNRKED
ncbi:MAG: carbohydrate ABC transporter permease [Clostridium sp.]|mgnify:FL=1|nr:sugar ABC transporter permease [Clostridium sp.]